MCETFKKGGKFNENLVPILFFLGDGFEWWGICHVRNKIFSIIKKNIRVLLGKKMFSIIIVPLYDISLT